MMIDSASAGPIQIGRRRLPPFSRRITTWLLFELSTPRRSTNTSTMLPSRPGSARTGGPLACGLRSTHAARGPGTAHGSGPHVPRREVSLLLGRQCVDVHAHRGQLEACDLAIDCLGDTVDVRAQGLG